MIFLLRCRHCGNTMKFQAATMMMKGKRKRCVYCGKSFEVSRAVIEQL
ncbi:MAG: hypothetical protein KJ709_07920 [Nanoarchaeota archaeon]|nr:hypothetical protein [Nanoarchaeota archaeon]